MSKTIKIGTYNIAACRQIERNAKIIAKDIDIFGLDIVGLQEVDRFTLRSYGADMQKDIVENSRLKHSYFVKTIDLEGKDHPFGEYGIMLLSRFPIIRAEAVLLPSEKVEQRAYIRAEIDVDGDVLTFYNTHLSHEDKENRKKQFYFLAKDIAAAKRFVLTGDFNTYDFEDFAPIKNGLLLNNEENRIGTCLFPTGEWKSIDNIVYSKNFTYKNRRILECDHSDHVLFAADFEWQL